MKTELERHGYRISPGTLYPSLHRMETQGLLTSDFEVISGHRRRVYTITEAGRTALTEGRRAVRELAGEVLDASGASAGGKPESES